MLLDVPVVHGLEPPPPHPVQVPVMARLLTVVVPETFREEPWMVMGMPALPMTMLVDEAVPRFKAPTPSTVTAASPDRPDLLTVSMAWAAAVIDRKRTSRASNR